MTSISTVQLTFVREGNVLKVVKHVNFHPERKKTGENLYIIPKTDEDRKSRNKKSKDKMAKEIAKCDLVMD